MSTSYRQERALRIGFIGAGTNSRQRHLPGFRAVDGIELAAVANRSEASSESVAKEFGIGRVAANWQEIANDPEIDAVCIGTWPNLHAEATIACLEAGKHVLCEARMARDLAEAQRMEICDREHPELVLQLVPSPLTLELDQTVRGMIDREEIGEVREVRITVTGPAAADPATPLTWRFDKELSGMNTMMLGIYHEAVQRWLPGEPAWVSADAEIFTPSRRDPETGEPRPVEIPEVLTVTGRYPTGTRIVYHFSGIETNTPVNDIRVNGSKACLRLMPDECRIERTWVGTGEQEDIQIADARGWQVEDDFVASVRGKRPVTLTSPEQGLRYMELTERVWRSWNQGGARIGRLLG
jgi:predicted dehydrogenase